MVDLENEPRRLFKLRVLCHSNNIVARRISSHKMMTLLFRIALLKPIYETFRQNKPFELLRLRRNVSIEW